MSDEKRIAEIRERIAWMVWACEIEAYDEKSWDTWNDPGVRSFAEREHYYRCADKILALTRLEEAEKVMKFYADPDTWGKSLDGVRVQSPLGHDRSTAPNGHDCPGAKARRWLEGGG